MRSEELQALCTGVFLAGYAPAGGVYGPRFREDYGPPEQRTPQYVPWQQDDRKIQQS